MMHILYKTSEVIFIWFCVFLIGIEIILLANIFFKIIKRRNILLAINKIIFIMILLWIISMFLYGKIGEILIGDSIPVSVVYEIAVKMFVIFSGYGLFAFWLLHTSKNNIT